MKSVKNIAPTIEETFHEQHLGRVTASRVAAILNVPTAHQNRDDVMREMVRDYFGYPRETNEFVQKKIMDRGKLKEVPAISLLEKEKKLLVFPAEFSVHPDFDWLGASPDGEIAGENIGVEAKSPIKKCESIKKLKHYWHQCQCQCAVKGYEGVWFVNRLEIDGELVDHKIEFVKADPNWLSDNFDELKAFYDDYLAAIKIPEEENPHLQPLVVERDDPDWMVATLQWRTAKAEYMKAEAAFNAAKEQLLVLANGRKSHGENVLVYPVKKAGAIGYAKIVKEKLPDLTDKELDKYRGKASSYWAIREDSEAKSN